MHDVVGVARVKELSSHNIPKHIVSRWTTLKRSAATVVFLAIAILAESLVVAYAASLGVKDETALQWSAKLPSSDWSITLAVSPLFHLVPITVIMTLISTWMYMSRQVFVPPSEVAKTKLRMDSQHMKEKDVRLFGRAMPARATVRSALTVLIVFSGLVMATSFLVYPQLIYENISGSYQSNSSFLSFVRGTGEALAPVGSVFSVVNSALLSLAPSFRNFVIGIGGAISFPVSLDNAGKYLVFQNAAAWISAIAVLLHGEYGRSYRRHRK